MTDHQNVNPDSADFLTLPHGAAAIRRGCDCSEHLIMPGDSIFKPARCGYDGCWLDDDADDDTCAWEPCPRCWEE